MGHNSYISETKAGIFGWLGFSYHLEDLGDEADTEQLTAVADARLDIIFMPHDDPEIF